MFRRIFPAFAGLLLSSAVLWAADSASFVDLGFSPDGGTYIFAQYGVKSGALLPWADMYVVDVERNDFVKDGRISYTHDSPISAGQDGSGALFHIIMKNSAIAELHDMQFPNQGMPLYIALGGDPAYDGKPITFRDFTSGSFYRASLKETISGNGSNLRSSFYIDLEIIDSNGRAKAYKIGTPEIQRPLIASYRIKKALISPGGNSLIFVIEMKRLADNPSAGGPDIRYMVEALRL